MGVVVVDAPQLVVRSWQPTFVPKLLEWTGNHPHDAIPSSEETKRRVAADEAGCAGYEDCSWHPLPFVSSFKVAASGVPTFTSKPK